MYVFLILKIRHTNVISIRAIQVRTIKISVFDSHFLIHSTYVYHITGKGKLTLCTSYTELYNND